VNLTRPPGNGRHALRPAPAVLRPCPGSPNTPTPQWYHAVPPGVRMVMVAGLMSAAYFLIAFGGSIGPQVCCGAAAACPLDLGAFLGPHQASVAPAKG
jgi:hypothetical protein